MEYSIAQVWLLGMGIVFFGLICLVGLISLLGLILREREPRRGRLPADSAADRAALKVAVQAALAEYLQVDFQVIKILSFVKHEEEK